MNRNQTPTGQASTAGTLARLRDRAFAALTRYLAAPIARPVCDSPAIPASLHRGDVLLIQGNSRFAAVIKWLTRSAWTHVAMYVGPLDNGPDPLCVVEADIATGVRPIRLSELDALQLRVLRPLGLTDMDRTRLADWIVRQIGSEYDLAHAWRLLGIIVRRVLPSRFRAAPRAIAQSGKRFICCSLLAHAFAGIGLSILAEPAIPGSPATADVTQLLPSDFERASRFQIVEPPVASD